MRPGPLPSIFAAATPSTAKSPYSKKSTAPVYFINIDDCLTPDGKTTEVLGLLLTTLTLSKHPCVLVSRKLNNDVLLQHAFKQHQIHCLADNPMQLLSLHAETLDLSAEAFSKLSFAESIARYNEVHGEIPTDTVGYQKSDDGLRIAVATIASRSTFALDDSRFISKDGLGMSDNADLESRSLQIKCDEGSGSWFNDDFISVLRYGHVKSHTTSKQDDPATSNSFRHF